MNLVPWKRKQKTESAEVESHPITQFRSEIDRLFDRFFQEPWGALGDPFPASGDLQPNVDVRETEKEILIHAEIPGVDPKDLEVSLSENVLTLQGEKRSCSEKKEGGAVIKECSYGSFHRAIPLAAEVDPEGVEAEHKNGVVTIKLAKSRVTPTKKISIKTR